MGKIVNQKNKSRKSSKRTRQLSKLKLKFIEYYAKLPIQKLAAVSIGKDEDTITNWKKNDKKFSDRLGTAKSEWVLNTSGKVKSAEWLLERIMKEYFSEKIETEQSLDKRLEEFLDRHSKMLP